MSTQYERLLRVEGLSFEQLMALKRERKEELSALHGRSYQLESQLDRINAALRKVKGPDA